MITILFSLLILGVWVTLPLAIIYFISRFLKARRWNRPTRVLVSIVVFVISLPIITWALLALFGSYLAIQIYGIQGGSMLPTYKSYDMVLINALDREFSRKDVVIFNAPHSPSNPQRAQIARVIGLPNEDVLIWDGDVKINGTKLDEEPYWSDESVTRGEVALTLRDKEYFLMGDNRVTALDSRQLGEVKEENIIGKVFYKLPL